MSEKKAKVKLELFVAQMGIKDVKSDIERYGLGVVISVWKQELMDIIEELDE